MLFSPHSSFSLIVHLTPPQWHQLLQHWMKNQTCNHRTICCCFRRRITHKISPKSLHPQAFIRGCGRVCLSYYPSYMQHTHSNFTMDSRCLSWAKDPNVTYGKWLSCHWYFSSSPLVTPLQPVKLSIRNFEESWGTTFASTWDEFPQTTRTTNKL